MATNNKIARHKLIGKTVIITKGDMKGQNGRVTHVNGNMADLEMLSRRHKFNISIDCIREDRTSEPAKMDVTMNREPDAGA